MRLALLLSLALHGLLLAAFAWQFRPLPALTPPLQVLLLPASLSAAAVMTAPRGGNRAVAPAALRQPAAAPAAAAAAAARRAAPPPSTPSTPSTPSPLPAATPPATAPATGKAAVVSAAAPAGSSSGSGSNAEANLATASTAPAAAEGKAGGTEKAGESRAVRVRFSPKPPYPALSRELGEEGVVLLRISVGAGGEFEQVQLLRSSGFVRLDRAARDGVRSWRFDAAWQDGQPVAASIDIPVRFRLDES